MSSLRMFFSAALVSAACAASAANGLADDAVTIDWTGSGPAGSLADQHPYPGKALYAPDNSEVRPASHSTTTAACGCRTCTKSTACPSCESGASSGGFMDWMAGLRRRHDKASALHHQKYGKHLLNPSCSPVWSPNWGYHPTCWRRFPPTCPCPPNVPGEPAYYVSPTDSGSVNEVELQPLPDQAQPLTDQPPVPDSDLLLQPVLPDENQDY